MNMVNGNIIEFNNGKRGLVVDDKVILFKGSEVDGFCRVSDFTDPEEEKTILRILSSEFNGDGFDMKALCGVKDRLIAPKVLWEKDIKWDVADTPHVAEMEI